MKFSLKLGKKDDSEDEFEELMKEEIDIAGLLPIHKWSVPEGYVEVEYYPLRAPFSYAAIVQNEETMEYMYVLDELPLTREEREGYIRLKNILEYELQAPKEGETLPEAFRRQMPAILEKHQKVLQGIDPVGLQKILYYLERDMAGYGKIDPLMYDDNV
ncbi:hypothetical protein H5T51_00490, partial [Candidatus Bathyarchaeota archaeon]|nr:hypothetical protein [Candidatus Bathyarchaeota archaeon]